MFETLLVPIIIVLAVLYILSIIIIPNMLDSFADTHYLELNQNERGDYMFELKPIKELPVEEELCQPIEYPVYRVFSRPLRVINISRISPIKIEEVSRGIKDLKAVLEKKDERINKLLLWNLQLDAQDQEIGDYYNLLHPPDANDHEPENRQSWIMFLPLLLAVIVAVMVFLRILGVI